MEGWGGDGCYLLLCFLFYSIIYILGLVCYKHTIHADHERSEPLNWLANKTGEEKRPIHHPHFLGHTPQLHFHDSFYHYAWWSHFLPTWPGSSLFLQSQWTLAPDMELCMDASNLGYGAYRAGRWFNQSSSPEQVTFTITWRELYIILVACSTWGHLWPRKRILFYCDNAAVVKIWGKGHVRMPTS